MGQIIRRGALVSATKPRTHFGMGRILALSMLSKFIKPGSTWPTDNSNRAMLQSIKIRMKVVGAWDSDNEDMYIRGYKLIKRAGFKARNLTTEVVQHTVNH